MNTVEPALHASLAAYFGGPISSTPATHTTLWLEGGVPNHRVLRELPIHLSALRAWDNFGTAVACLDMAEAANMLNAGDDYLVCLMAASDTCPAATTLRTLLVEHASAVASDPACLRQIVHQVRRYERESARSSFAIRYRLQLTVRFTHWPLMRRFPVCTALCVSPVGSLTMPCPAGGGRVSPGSQRVLLSWTDVSESPHVSNDETTGGTIIASSDTAMLCVASYGKCVFLAVVYSSHLLDISHCLVAVM